MPAAQGEEEGLPVSWESAQVEDLQDCPDAGPEAHTA